MHVSGPKIIGPEVKERMKAVLKEIDSGKFAENWMDEVRNGAPQLKQQRENLASHLLEKTGSDIRKLFTIQTEPGEPENEQ